MASYTTYFRSPIEIGASSRDRAAPTRRKSPAPEAHFHELAQATIPIDLCRALRDLNFRKLVVLVCNRPRYFVTMATTSALRARLHHAARRFAARIISFA